MNSMDVTPDSEGVARWARKVLAEAPEGSRDAHTARNVLAEFAAGEITKKRYEQLRDALSDGLEPSSGIEPD
ncbi:MAG: hypothetical protein ACRDTI_05635 [Mycobacterium sp.]